MQGLLIGLDLCDDYSQISIFNEETMDAEPFFLDEEKTKSLICIGKSSFCVLGFDYNRERGKSQGPWLRKREKEFT